jgi:hypothetical protein
MTEPHEPGDMVERVAKAIADRRGSDIVQWFHKDDAKAAVAAMNAASGADRMREALERMLAKADAVRALGEEWAPKMPSPLMWGDDVAQFKDAIDFARQALGEPQ